MANYVNLHTHTIGSLLDSSGKVEDYFIRAKELGMNSLASTDHGNIHLWLDFYETAQKYDIKPLLGIETYQSRKTRWDKDVEELAGKATAEFAQRGPYHLTLLARDMDGYRNIIKLSSLAYLEGWYGRPRCDWELLEKYSKGVTILSGCLAGAVCEALMLGNRRLALETAARYQEIAGKDHFYIEIMDHGLEEQLNIKEDLFTLAKKLGAKAVPTGDCHYVRKEDSKIQDLSLCISTGSTISQENRFKFKPEEFYLKSYEEMLTRFPKESLKNTLDIADSIDLKLEFGELHFPKFDIPNGENIDTYFERQVRNGLWARFGKPMPLAVKERALYELGVIKRMGFQHYFLVVADILQFCRDSNIRVGAGRGSSASSIISYAMNITKIDPLKYDLLFERFLIEGRNSPPDIDIDIDDRYRDQVIAYVIQKYGKDRVSNICTFSTIGARAAIRDTARVLGKEYSVGDKLSKLMPLPFQGVSKTIGESLELPEVQKEYNSNPEAKEIIDAARSLEGLIRQTGQHAAGICITPGPTIDYVPVMRKNLKDGNPGPIITQWDKDRIDQCGVLKIDFLGLRNLSVIDRCVANIKQTKEIDLDIDNLDLTDSKVYEYMRTGAVKALFQIESSGLREMLIALKPDKIEDIMALIALYRPGPLGSHIDKEYIERKHGRKEIVYEHPKLESILKDTYGLCIYQENILAVSRILAGFTVSEADDLRKCVGKKLVDKIGLFRDKFVEGCTKTSNMNPKLSNKIYSDIEYFGAYGFPKPHSAAYSFLTFDTAYLKYYYPAEYMAAVLTSLDDKSKMSPYLNECRRMGISVLAPSINRSSEDFTILSDKEILFGLRSIAGIGAKVMKHLINEDNNFTNIYDFMRRATPEVLNTGTIEHLVYSGALDELIEEPEPRAMSRQEKMDVLSHEEEQLGLYVSDHPLNDIQSVLDPLVTNSIGSLDTLPSGSNVVIGGLLTNAEKKVTKKGASMYILTLEDLTGNIEVLVFPRQSVDTNFRKGDIALIEGRVEEDGEDKIKLFFSKITYPDLSKFNATKSIYIELERPPLSDNINRAHKLIETNPGDIFVYVKFPKDDRIFTRKFKSPTSHSIQGQLKELLACTKV